MNNEIEVQLSLLGIPFSFEEHSANDSAYIVYSEYDNRPALFGDNQEIVETYFYQFDIFSTGDYTIVEKNLKDVLKTIGGIRLSQFSNFEEGYYQKSIRFKFNRESK